MKEKQIEQELNLNLREQDINLFEAINFLYSDEFEEMIKDLKNGY